jgi:hypothetical protein
MVIFENKNTNEIIKCNDSITYFKTRLELLQKRIIQDYVVKLDTSMYPIIENNDLIVQFDEYGELNDWFTYIDSYFGGGELYCENLYYVLQYRKEQRLIKQT